MTVTGAARILSTFLGFNDRASRFLPSCEVTKTKRAGQEFMLVGPAAVMA